ncbi:PEBP-like protein [Alternaria alternata]|nr:PEBP-like protein [Alternaria alternata]
MFTKTILSATALLAGVATAATAPGFPIQVSQNLTVMYGNNTVSPGGELIPRPGSPLVIPSDNPVPYLQPSPPVGDIPHSYTFILMAQPRNFSIPSMYDDLADNRVGFNVSQFAADANLTNGIAATWITVQNLTETPTNTSFPPPRPSPTGDGADSGGAASGDASGMMIAGRTFWAAMSTTVVAVVFAIAL